MTRWLPRAPDGYTYGHINGRWVLALHSTGHPFDLEDWVRDRARYRR